MFVPNKNSPQAFWLSSKMKFLFLAKEQGACILICGYRKDTVSEGCLLAQLLGVDRQGLTLRLALDKEAVLSATEELSLSFTVEDSEAVSHVIKARSRLLEVRQNDRALVLCLALPHEFSCRQVRRHERLVAHELRLMSCGMTPLNYFPRNAAQVRYAVSACHGLNNFVETHDISISGISFLIDKDQAQRTQSAELFFVSAVVPSLGPDAACHLMASKVAISHCEGRRKSRLHLGFAAELSLLSPDDVSWVHLGKGEGSKQLAALLSSIRGGGYAPHSACE